MDSARIMDKLMVGLGFEAGYALQGGDIGSYTARIMAATYDGVKGETSVASYLCDRDMH